MRRARETCEPGVVVCLFEGRTVPDRDPGRFGAGEFHPEVHVAARIEVRVELKQLGDRVDTVPLDRERARETLCGQRRNPGPLLASNLARRRVAVSLCDAEHERPRQQVQLDGCLLPHCEQRTLAEVLELKSWVEGTRVIGPAARL